MSYHNMHIGQHVLYMFTCFIQIKQNNFEFVFFYVNGQLTYHKTFLPLVLYLVGPSKTQLLKQTSV